MSDPSDERTRNYSPNQEIFGSAKRLGGGEEPTEKRQGNPESDWADEARPQDTRSAPSRAMLVIVGLLLIGVAAAVTSVAMRGDADEAVDAGGAEAEEYAASPEAIAKFAQTFADAAGDREKRLSMARSPRLVAQHLADYPEETLSGVVESMHLMGAGRQVADPPRTAFVATMEGGGRRLLVVVEEEGELRVDWDVFARYGTAPWIELLGGGALRADVRIFLMADDYYNGRFADDTKWRSFRLRSPDVNEPMYAYAEFGSLREKYLSAVAVMAPPAGSRMLIRVARRGGSAGRNLFEIERLLAAGWIEDGIELEEKIELGGEKAVEQLRSMAPQPPRPVNPGLPTEFPGLE